MTPEAATPAEPLIEMDRRTRLERLRLELLDEQLDALWVTKPENVRYLCGFTGSNAQLLVLPDHCYLITDGRYETQSATQLTSAGLQDEVLVQITTMAPESELGDLAVLGAADVVGYEDKHLSVAKLGLVTAALADNELRPASQLVTDLRRVKDDGERQRLSRASAIADTALAEVRELLRPGIAEWRFAAELDYLMRIGGSERPSFSTIVASGPNSAIPHHEPGDRKLADGDLVVVDFGATIDGYGSDMTRTMLVGDKPSPEQQRLYDAVERAQAEGVACVASGVALRSVDTRCREVLEQYGYGDAFMHGTGHSLGLEIHEEPMLSSRSVGSLRAGHIVTVEPGAYIPGFGGVRVEDTVVVTETGCVAITHAPKGLTP